MQKPEGVARRAKTYAATEARAKFSDIFDEAYFGDHVLVTKRDRQVAIVSISFLEMAERLIQREADKEVKVAQEALTEFQSKGGKTLEQIKLELEVD